MTQEPTNLITVINHQHFLPGLFLFRNNLDQLGDLLLLHLIQLYQITIRLDEFHGTFHIMASPQRNQYRILGSRLVLR